MDTLQLQALADGTLNSPEARTAALKHLEAIVKAAPTHPDLVFKTLRNLCQEGAQVQTEIAEHPEVFIESSSRFYPQFLNNLSQESPTVQAKVWEVAHSLALTAAHSKAYAALFYSLLVKAPSRVPSFLTSQSLFLQDVLLKTRSAEDDAFQWYFLLLSKALHGHLPQFWESVAISPAHTTELLGLIRHSMEKAWDERLDILSEETSGTLTLTLEDAEFLAVKFCSVDLADPEYFVLLLEVIDYLSRAGATNPQVQLMLVNQGVPEVCWGTLSALDAYRGRQEFFGTKTTVLHILANTCDRNLQAIEVASRYLHTLLNCTSIDAEHLYTREWAVLLIRYLTSQSETIRTRIASFKPLDVTPETRARGVELDPVTLRPYYKSPSKSGREM